MDRRAPLAALLILVGLLLGAGSVSNARASLGDPGARLAQSSPASSQFLPAGRTTLSDEEPRPDAKPFLTTSPATIVVEGASSRPRAQAGTSASSTPSRAPAAGYRARAPPAA